MELKEFLVGLAAFFTLFGAVFGAIGASSLFWREETRKKWYVRLKVGRGKTLSEKVENYLKDLEIDKARDIVRDKLTVIGWSFIIVGALAGCIALFIPMPTA